MKVLGNMKSIALYRDKYRASGLSDRYGHPRQTVFGRRHASAAATVSYSSVPHAHLSTSSATASTSSSTTQDPTKLPTTGPQHTPAPSATGTGGVRRNLFQSQLTRRPTGTAGGGNDVREPLMPTETGMVLGRLDGGKRGAGAAAGGGLLVGVMDVDDDDGSADIVVRDKNGDVELDEPPALVVDDPEEIALDMRQENEKERQRLADAVKHHQINQNSVPAQPEELLEAVRASLRAKVAALAEDNWMYEKEDQPRIL
ncbi:hypothetical protein VPNG_02413 [Cytospora leucostoma]|uniref:Uncharacterized protein n=1 Tax=Cytospora leucostoma TaxID=1230097 RepID=A0A423XGQ6_9PEZI|nr:hypothetical protein VPNG_02413 [Cytospora leucostoma]